MGLKRWRSGARESEPIQLGHTAATLVRREMGLDAARTLLGHRSLGITDTYAELDQALAVEAARKLG